MRRTPLALESLRVETFDPAPAARPAAAQGVASLPTLDPIDCGTAASCLVSHCILCGDDTLGETCFPC